MRAGGLKKRVTIQQQGDGVNEYNEKTGAWITVVTLWASPEPLRGQEYLQANENAARALQQAKAYPGSCSFFVSEELKVIGPLRSSDVIQFSEHGDAETVALAAAIGMNNINLQKIMSYAKMTGTNKLTSDDVAKCLSITIRGANRILNKIEEKNQAKSIFERLDSGKGRPKKYYELLFLDNDGDMRPGN